MSKTSTFTKAMSMLLAVLMVLSLLPVMGASAADYELAVNETELLTFTKSDSMQSWTWSSSDLNKVSVSANGKTATIRALEATASDVTITCVGSLAGMFTETQTWTVSVGGGSAPSTPTPDTPTTENWNGTHTYGELKAFVDAGGEAYFDAACTDPVQVRDVGGTYNIHFYGNKGYNNSAYSNNYGYDSYTLDFDVYIRESVIRNSSITLNPTSVSIDLSGSTNTAAVTATVEGCTVSGVSSSNTSVVTVNRNGNTITVTGVSAGTATITVSGAGNEGYNDPDPVTFTVTVTAPGASVEDGLTVSKTADKDGQTIGPNDTVKLDMEAYPTGTTVTVPVTGVAGSYDVVLVLDTTFSMNNSIGSTTRLAALKSAVGTMIDALPTDASSKLKVVNFQAYGTDYYSPSYNQAETSGEFNLSATGKANIKTYVNGLTPLGNSYQHYGFTYPDKGMTAAESVINGWTDTNAKYVVFFTDGEPTNNTTAVQTINTARTLKAAGVKMYSIGILADGRGGYASSTGTAPSGSASISFNGATNTTGANHFLHAVSSNYPNASASGSTITFGSGSDQGYYMLAANSTALTSAFSGIATTITTETQSSSTSVTLDKNAVFQDVINTDKFDVSGATATVTIYDYDNGWSALNGASISANAGNSSTLSNWTGKSTNDGTLTLNFNSNGTVTVTGFSYKDHYLPTNGTEAQNVNAQKVHLTISGLKLKANAQTAEQQNNVPTNVEVSSGVFAKSGDTSPAVPFPVPTVNIAAQTQFTYYAKLVYHANGGQNPPAAVTKNATTTESSAVISFDQATPDPTRDGYTFLGWSADSGNSNTVNVAFPYSITTSKTTAATAETKTVYAVWAKNDSKTVTIDFSSWIKIADGVSSITSGDKGSNGEFKIFEGALYYKLTDKTLLNQTNKNVILTDFEETHDTVTVKLTNGGIGTYIAVPASNIYFDDNLDSDKLITNGAGGTTEESAKPTVGDVTLVKTDNGAYYAITFTGTGIDIYSTTDSNSGYVQAWIQKTDGTRLGISTMKNYSADVRYNVPSFSFTGYARDTYLVKIYVLEGSNYRFDGIRVYGPMDCQEVYENTNEQYAVYANLREALINNVQTVSIDASKYGLTTEEDDPTSYTGALFIDGTSAQKPLPMTVTKDDGQTVAIYRSQFEAYKNNGPKHEIYLNGGQSIAFTLNGVSGARYYIGLSAPDSKTGTGSVTVNNDDDSIVNVISPVDMYYDITEYVTGNTITIKNAGSSMISVTNLKITGDKTLFDNVRAAENGGTGTITVTSEEGRNILFASAKRTVLAMAEAAETQPLEITAQPQDYVGKVNTVAVFRVEAAGEGLTYQWQFSDDNGRTWKNSAVKSAAYSSKLSSGRDGRLVRCSVRDANGNQVISEAAAMQVLKLSIVSQPQNCTGKVNSIAVFRVEAAGDGLTYQWQFSDDNGRTWKNSAVKSAAYSTKLTAARDGRLVRCIVTDQYGLRVTTTPASMTIG